MKISKLINESIEDNEKLNSKINCKIVLKDGKTFYGHLLSVNENYVYINSDNGNRIKKDDIKELYMYYDCEVITKNGKKIYGNFVGDFGDHKLHLDDSFNRKGWAIKDEMIEKVNYKKVIKHTFDTEKLNESVNLLHNNKTIDIDGEQKSIYNSRGEKIADTEESLRKFYKWFNNSKAVDSKNRPYVMYHGTYDKFDSFSYQYSGKNDSGFFGKGFYFTYDYEYAKKYGKKIMRVYLKINNPYKMTTDSKENMINYMIKNGHMDKKTASSLLNKLNKAGEIVGTGWLQMADKESYKKISRKISEMFSESLIKDGYDGIMTYREYMVFNPNQIKSVKNNGNWSMSYDNINESVEDKILYIIRGLPGSGKSTLAYKLTDNVVEADQYFYDDKGNYNWSADKLHQAHNWCYNTVKKYMEEGRDKIAVANTFVKTKDYKNYVELAKEFNYKVDIKTCKGNYGSIHNVPEETMNKMRNKFQETPLNESDGKLIAYHGSQHKKFNFRDDKVLYLTTNKEKAISYAKREWDEGLIEGEVPVVYTFEVSIKKPYICHTEDEFQCEFCDVNMNEEGGKEELIEKGYDSIKYHDLIGVFSSSQIKLVDTEVLPPSMDYYYPKDEKYGDEDINDYYYDEEELKESYRPKSFAELVRSDINIEDYKNSLVGQKVIDRSDRTIWEITRVKCVDYGKHKENLIFVRQEGDTKDLIATPTDIKNMFHIDIDKLLPDNYTDGSNTELDESINDEPKIGDKYSCLINYKNYNESMWEIIGINSDKEYIMQQIKDKNNKIITPKDNLKKNFLKLSSYDGSETQLDESINDKPKIGDIYELQITENKGQLFEVTKKLPNNFYEVTSLTRSKGQPLGYVEYLEISEKNLLNWFRRYDDYKYEGDDTQLDESEQKVWPDGSKFVAKDGIWQIYGNDGKSYDLMQLRDDGIKIKWKLSMSGFPGKDLIPYEKNNYEGNDTELDESFNHFNFDVDDKIEDKKTGNIWKISSIEPNWVWIERKVGSIAYGDIIPMEVFEKRFLLFKKNKLSQYSKYNGDDTELDEDASKDKAFLGEQIAYCGSEKDYDVPDLKIIGNGEGTAVHGYGFYFARDFNIANRYRMAYIKKPYSYIFKGIIYNKIDICSNINKDTMFKQIMYDLLKKIYHEKMTLNDVLQECENEIEYYDNSIKNVNKDKKDYIKFCKICLNGYINAKKFFINVNEEDINNIQIYGGQVLKVELPENEYLIDEQKSLKEQSKYVKNILYKIFKKLNIDYNEDMSGKDILVDISNANMLKNKSSHLPLSKNRYELSDDIRDFYYENQKNVYIFGSLMLANNGIKGITYIGNEDGRCYVIFDPNDIKIIDKLIKENYNNIISDDSDILMEGIDEVKKYFPNVPENMFQKLVDLDPTYKGGNKLGNYGKWILQLYNKGLIKPEDFNKVSEYLITYKDNLSKMPNKDISKYKTLEDLEQAVKLFIGQKDISKKEQARIIKKDAKKIMETDEWLCITPLTEEASCYYGANTKWCTASKENNMFNSYNKDGPLYIFINKKDSSKYQFHPETLEFRNALDNKVPPAGVFNDKTILKFIKEKVMEAIENGDLDIYDGGIITGLTNDEDSLAIIATNSFSFFSSIFNYSNGTKEEQMFDLLSEYNEYGIDEIYHIIKDMALTFSNSEKINKLKDDVYKQKLEELLVNIKDMILLQINEHQDVWNVWNYKYKEDLEEMQIYVDLISNNYKGYYDDVVLEWFMNYNIDTPHNVLTQISDGIITPESNLKKVTESFLEGLREIFKEMDNDDHIKESIIKNPSFEMIQETLKEQDLGFTFNPIKNDLIIYKDISLMESTNNLSGILSPKLVEIKSDDEEYAEKVLSNSLKKIFPDGYKMIVY